MALMDDFLEEKGMTRKENQQEYSKYKRIEKALSDFVLCEMKRDEFVEVFKMLNLKTAGNFNRVKTKLKEFILWSVNNGAMTEEQIQYIKEITFDELEDLSVVQKSYVASLDELTYLFTKSNMNSEQFDTFKAAFFLCWVGIEPSKIVDVCKDNLGKTGISFDERWYSIDDERILAFLKKYCEAKSYGDKRFGEDVSIKYKDGEYLLRSFRNDHLTYKQIRASTSGLAKEMDKQISLGKVYESGIYYRMMIDEKKSGEFRMSQVDRVASFFRVNPYPSITYTKVKDYRRWKKAFYGEEDVEE